MGMEFFLFFFRAFMTENFLGRGERERERGYFTREFLVKFENDCSR